MSCRLLSVFSLGFALAVSLAASAQTTSVPEITSQGFDMSEPQAGRLGKFGRLRVRFEAPERIAELIIKERSYEVDLASTLEPENLHLFGATSRPRGHRDITLDFENYINKKLENGGQYDFAITLRDKEGQSASARLSVVVTREKTSLEIMEDRLDRTARGAFSFRRVGSGPVVGASDFGLTWKTIEASNVTIRITNAQNSTGKLLRLMEPAFDSANSKKQLADSAADIRPAESIEIPAAENGAAGQTFAVTVNDELYLLRIKESKTQLSELGTTVILSGEYKH